MARVVYSPRAVEHLDQAFAFLGGDGSELAERAVEAITSAVELLASHPLIGRIVTGTIRELVISFGRTGYVALYRHVPARDEVRVLAIRHQRQLDYP